MKKIILATALTVLAMPVFSEDIELYVSDAVKNAAKKKQVLIILDNSGSMASTQSVKTKYNPATDYPAVGGAHAFSDKFIYFTKGGVDGVSLPTPDSPSEARRFLDSINSCQTAKEVLAVTGFYTGHVREYTFKGSSGKWGEIPDNNGANIDLLDCEDDVLALNNKNADGLDIGFPVDGLGTKFVPVYHTANAADSNVNWSGDYVTLYTDNYLRWYKSEVIPEVPERRIDIAINSLSDIIASTPSVDFGLQVFNNNSKDANKDGGRIVYGIKEMTLANKAELLDLIQNNINAETWTPLCETLYEASRYFAGDNVDFGNKDTRARPRKDTDIISSSKYISPFTGCSDVATVVLITDGEPTYDDDANAKIEALNVLEVELDADGNVVLDADGKPVYKNTKFSGDKVKSSYLAALAGWMYEHDINPNIEGIQTVSTTTIGFTPEDEAELLAPLLSATATAGGGKYFSATSGVSLTNALRNTLENLGESNNSLTSASVAGNNFDRTQTLDSVYYAMFTPQNGPRWQGNLKKYKIVGETQVGSNGVVAVDDTTGVFSEKVLSYWSSNDEKGKPDGNKVDKGGVAEWFNTATSRTLYTDINAPSSSAVMKTFTLDNVKGSFADLPTAAAKLGVATEDIDDTLKWAMGIDVDDEDKDSSTSDYRSDVFGDPLHSKPVILNYGNKIHILIGTNAGAFHMFKDNGDTVEETWAFMPMEFLGNIHHLRDNLLSTDKVYGVDGHITSYIKDNNGDGIVNDSDKAYVFFGLRRGGTSYYGLDVTDPDNPKLIWHIDNTTDKFTNLGQSWSRLKLGYSILNVSGDNAKPVLFFGGGYDEKKDGKDLTIDDSVGLGIYMIDAISGEYLWSMAPDGATTVFTGTDSIPSSIAILDSDADGLVDRLYTGDTGGNLWRVDMPGADPKDTLHPWTVFKLAKLGGNTDVSDRRFFSAPSIARTIISETIKTEVDPLLPVIVSQVDIPYDAILLGSGDRSNPLGTDTEDAFFMIKDEHIFSQSFTGSSIPAIPDAIEMSGLYDYTDNPFGAYKPPLTAAQKSDLETLSFNVSEKDGWYIKLTQAGEKNTSSAFVLDGFVYFTSYTPPNLDPDVLSCSTPSGNSYLYVVDLALGISKYNWATEDVTNRGDTIKHIGDQPLDTPTLVIIPEIKDEDGKITTPKSSGIIVGREFLDADTSTKTQRTSQMVLEN